jgi:hypothetical protein
MSYALSARRYVSRFTAGIAEIAEHVFLLCSPLRSPRSLRLRVFLVLGPAFIG